MSPIGAADPIDAVYLAQLDPSDRALLGAYGVRMVVLAMRERWLDRLQHGLLMAVAAAIRNGDDRDIMIGLALPHVAAAQLGAQPALVFETAAARFEEGWCPNSCESLEHGLT